MLRLRPFLDGDTDAILTWPADERSFYQWSAGRFGAYPLTREAFEARRDIMRFTAEDDGRPVGFFTLRNPGESSDEVRFGFVIVDPALRGRGVGAGMLRLGLTYARSVYRAKLASLGVFENNEPAYRCYYAVGFRDTGRRHTCGLMGETWPCIEMELQL